MSLKRLVRRSCAGSAQWTRILLLGLALMVLASCVPKPASTPPSAPPASRVITEGGVEFFVWELKLPGTNQDLLLRQGRARTWLPLGMVRGLQFTGPEREGYRPATIVLVTGERTQGEVFVDRLIVGMTDLGYWNLPLREVYFLDREAP